MTSKKEVECSLHFLTILLAFGFWLSSPPLSTPPPPPPTPHPRPQDAFTLGLDRDLLYSYSACSALQIAEEIRAKKGRVRISALVTACSALRKFSDCEGLGLQWSRSNKGPPFLFWNNSSTESPLQQNGSHCYIHEVTSKHRSNKITNCLWRSCTA